MDAAKRKRLEDAGWKIGTAAEFLGMTPAEDALVRLQIALRRAVEESRKESGLTVEQLAEKLEMSSERVRKLEAGIGRKFDFGLHFKAVFAAGWTFQKLAGFLNPPAPVKKAARVRKKKPAAVPA